MSCKKSCDSQNRSIDIVQKMIDGALRRRVDFAVLRGAQDLDDHIKILVDDPEIFGTALHGLAVRPLFDCVQLLDRRVHFSEQFNIALIEQLLHSAVEPHELYAEFFQIVHVLLL